MRDYYEYLQGLSPLTKAKVEKTLGTQVRVNGDVFMTRLALIVARASTGSRVCFRGDERVFMMPDGAWFDERNLTKTGMDFAAWLTTRPELCSICRAEHGLEVLHACE